MQSATEFAANPSTAILIRKTTQKTHKSQSLSLSTLRNLNPVLSLCLPVFRNPLAQTNTEVHSPAKITCKKIYIAAPKKRLLPQNKGKIWWRRRTTIGTRTRTRRICRNSGTGFGALSLSVSVAYNSETIQQSTGKDKRRTPQERKEAANASMRMVGERRRMRLIWFVECVVFVVSVSQCLLKTHLLLLLLDVFFFFLFFFLTKQRRENKQTLASSSSVTKTRTQKTLRNSKEKKKNNNNNNSTSVISCLYSLSSFPLMAFKQKNKFSYIVVAAAAVIEQPKMKLWEWRNQKKKQSEEEEGGQKTKNNIVVVVLLLLLQQQQ